jgi:DNA-binding NarL/FixJ family response regulator
MKEVRILIVDDQQMVREGLRRMLELDEGIEVVGEAKSGEECLACVDELNPDIILMDVRMPGMGGIECTRQLKQKGITAKIIILTVYEDKYLAQAAEVGAAGYLLKDINRQDLLKAIQLTVDGYSAFTPSITQSLFAQLASKGSSGNDQVLTARQLSILRLMAAGITNREIAAKLYLSEATIKRETNSVFTKLDVNDRAQAVSEGYKRNLL